MVQLAIRCHPRVPVSSDELEHWLEQQVHELRAAAPHATVRLSRLTQRAPGADLEIGWLVELELGEDEPLLAGHRLANALRDMRLLGLQPTLLAPRDARTNGSAASGSERVRQKLTNSRVVGSPRKTTRSQLRLAEQIGRVENGSVA